MSRATNLFYSVVFTSIFSIVCAASAVAADKSVAITAIVDHPALNALRDGVVDELKAAGYEPGKSIKVDYQSAQGSTATAGQIARKFVGDRASVIVPISTPSAQAVAVATKDIPIVFAGVGEPVAAGLVQHWGASGTNITGVSDMVPVDRQLQAIKQVLPNAKRIGIIYNPGEANSVALIKKMKPVLPQFGYTLVEATAPRSVDVSTAAKSLIGKVDVIFAPTDNTLASAFVGVAKVANDAKLPVFAGADSLVAEGAAFGLGVNYSDLGHQAGKMVVKILAGQAPGHIPPETSAKLVLYVNHKAAKAQGVSIPEELLKTAKAVD